jgi:hypothetical protein
MAKYRELANSFFGFAVGAVFVGLLTIGGSKFDLGDLDRQDLSSALVVTGSLDIPMHSGKSTIVRLTEADGSRWDCYIGHCGYGGVYEDRRKLARGWILSGKIVQIEVNGQVRFTLPERVAGHRNEVSLGWIFIALSPLLFAIGVHFRRKLNANNQSPL